MTNDFESLGFEPVQNTSDTSEVDQFGDMGFEEAPPLPQQELDIQLDNDMNQPESNNAFGLDANLDTPVKTITDPIIAAGTGLRSGITDFGHDVGEFITEQIGKLSPSLQKRMNQAGRTLMNKMDLADNAGFSGEAQREYPGINAIGKGIGYVGGATAASAALPGGGVPGILAQGLLGSAMAGEGNRVYGFAGGALVPAIVKGMTSSPSKYLSSSFKQADDVASLEKTLNTSPDNPNINIYQATDDAFAKFKSTPGTIETNSSIGAIDDFTNRFGQNLSKKQMKVVSELKNDIAKSKNLEELHAARKFFTKDLDSIFLEGNDALIGNTRKNFLMLKNAVEDNLQVNAKNLGVLDDYKKANELFKQSKEADIINEAINTTKLPEGGNNWVNFNRSIMKLKKAQARQLSEDTKKALDGISKTIQEANHIYGIRTKELGIFQPALSVIKGMFNYPLGRSLLIKAGSPGGRAIAKNIAEGLANVGQAKYIETAREQSVPQ